MARFTSELAAEMVGGRFDLVIIASQRARELKNGSKARIEHTDATTVVTALREIEAGLYTKKEFLEKMIKKNSKGNKYETLFT
jgi:DNA-directed RNA polymerase subunit omega